jgi:ferritin
MLKKVIQDKMNDQIKHELYSAYFYLSMAAYLEANNLLGSAHWMRVQAQEEQGHALKFFDHVYDRGGRVTLQAIDQPPAEFNGLLDVFEKVLAHEQKVTGLINDLYALAVQEKDYASQIFLQWFVDEQVEEEKNADQIVQQIKMIGDHKAALFMLDSHLGKRGE